MTRKELYNMLDTLPDSYCEAHLSDVEMKNNPGKDMVIIVKKGDTREYVDKIISERINLPAFVDRAPRDVTSVQNALKALGKAKTENDIVKKLKVLLKYSMDNTFPYRNIVDIIKSLECYDKDWKYTSETELNDENLRKIVISESIKSLEEHTVIHPKIKLLINMIGKTEEVEEVSDGFSINTII